MVFDLDFFTDKKKNIEVTIDEKEKINRRFSNLRLISFLLFLILIVVAIVKSMNIVLMVLACVFLALFIVLCVLHGKSKAELNHLITLRTVVENYIARIEGDFSKLNDSGEEFFDKDHNYALDLDVFGDNSLFALYNISHTAFGREVFAKNLLGEDLPEDISSTQEAVKEFIDNPELLIEYEAVAIEGKINKTPTALIEMYKNKAKVTKLYKGLLYGASCLWIIPFIILFINSKFISAAILAILLINVVLWFLASSKFASVFKSLDGVIRQTNSYYKLFDILENHEFKSITLKSLIKGGAKGDSKASDGLKVLSKACSYASMRSQPMLALILNSVFPYDILCADKLLSWSEKYGEELKKSIESIARIEALMCASVPGIISRESCFPTVVTGAFFDGTNITHPLLNPKKAVSNSIKLDKELALITGSNMSGKTTLIRTVGICSILALTGAPVPATTCTVGKMRVLSSMRIVDSIEEQMSTFRAELVRIGKIVEAAKNDNSPMLFLIDEIFRGTNSQDRTDGALAVLKNLDKSYITGLMTTHDYALCDKVQDTIDSVVYYHFSEVYNNNEIIFDYKLHDGVSHQSNAKFLMKLVGIDS